MAGRLDNARRRPRYIRLFNFRYLLIPSIQQCGKSHHDLRSAQYEQTSDRLWISTCCASRMYLSDRYAFPPTSSPPPSLRARLRERINSSELTDLVRVRRRAPLAVPLHASLRGQVPTRLHRCRSHRVRATARWEVDHGSSCALPQATRPGSQAEPLLRVFDAAICCPHVLWSSHALSNGSRQGFPYT